MGDLQPEIDEVLQVEEDYALSTVPVCITEVKSPVRVQQLPRKAGATMTRSIGITTAERVLRADHRRASALVVSASPFRYAFNEASCQATSAMGWQPANVPLPLSCTTELWVLVVGEAAADVSVCTELWATGEC